MSLIDLLCSTKANPQPKESAHVLQQTNLSTVTSTELHPVTTTQDVHLHTEAASALQQVPDQQRPVYDGQSSHTHHV